jgi:phosphoglucomutase
MLTGNQMGALLVNYVLMRRKEELNSKSALIKTIATSDLEAEIARSYGLHIVKTLTGFKYIGEQIDLLEKSGERKFVIGYEESCGYLVGTHSRDKDAVVSSLLICEMATYYKERGQTLIDVLNEIYLKYGFYLDALDSFTLVGIDGAERIKAIMSLLRHLGNSLMPGIESISDYGAGITGCRYRMC